MGAEERMKRSLKEYQYKEDMRNFASKQNDALNERMSKMLENSNNNLDYDTGYVRRYDNEGEFFQLLGRKDAFMHNMIKDKIKYFDPAFHSISPEGFNARLNFLHQCTRQGSTVDASNGGSQSTAYNLAFGRPPVCILRLGDFYNTKIVITNLSIQYDDAQWDLNPEGIGVMPVFAKISLSLYSWVEATYLVLFLVFRMQYHSIIMQILEFMMTVLKWLNMKVMEVERR